MPRAEPAPQGDIAVPLPMPLPPQFIYDPDWDEGALIADRLAILDQSRTLPATFSVAVALDAWQEIKPLQRDDWLGRLFAAAALRVRGKTGAHLACLHERAKSIPLDRRRPRDPARRLVMQLQTITAAATEGLKSHDRCLTLRTILARKLGGRRSASRLAVLIEFVSATPIVLAGMIAEKLAMTPRAAQYVAKELGLRKMMVQGRYRAWRFL